MSSMKKNNNFAGRVNFGFNAFTTVGFALAGIALTGTLNAGPIQPFNVLVADSQATIYSVNPRTREQTIVAQGGKLDRPYDLAVQGDGTIVVSDTITRRIVQVNPSTHEQTVVAEGDDLGTPFGLDVDKHNGIYVATSTSVLYINPKNGKVETVATGGLLRAALDVAVAPDGNVYVADVVSGIVRVNPANHKQTLIASGNMLHTPIGIVLDGNHSAYVADASGQCVVAVDLLDGTQKLVSMAGLLTSPVGIAMAPDGTLLVSDPDAFDLDGGLMTINPDGSQSPITRGYGDLVNARGIAIQPLTIVRQKFGE
jgi:streptogramin lyase